MIRRMFTDSVFEPNYTLYARGTLSLAAVLKCMIYISGLLVSGFFFREIDNNSTFVSNNEIDSNSTKYEILIIRNYETTIIISR